MIFDKYARRYDNWYDEYPLLYKSELKTASLARCERGVEIGLGTGEIRFPLGLWAGVDPSIEMLKLAPRELDKVQALGEKAPFRDNAIPCALVVVTLCFVHNPMELLREAARLAQKVVACIVPRNSPWGLHYARLAASGHPLYKYARFYTVGEVIAMGRAAGLDVVAIYATLPKFAEEYSPPAQVEDPKAEQYGFVCTVFSRGTGGATTRY